MNKKENKSQQFSLMLASGFSVGFFPFAPGTIGSLSALPMAYFSIYFAGQAGLVSLIGVFLIAGLLTTSVVLKTAKSTDPSFVVIDEIVGQLLAFFFVATDLHFKMTAIDLLWGFLLFRFFDIVKIWPASFFDKKVHTAFGVMMDDVVAGFYAAVILYYIHFYI